MGAVGNLGIWNSCIGIIGLILIIFEAAYCNVQQHQRSKRETPVDAVGSTISTKSGKIKGIRNYLPGLDKTVDSFWGVPFAKPPVGDLRFKLPVSPDSWQDVKQTVKAPPACPLILDNVFGKFKGADMWNDYNMSEDCLYLNVFVPKQISDENTGGTNKKYSVMVWIYGGGFYSGSSNLEMYQAKYLAATSDTIVVSLNYRVGIFGFFTLDHASTPKNVGLYDQLKALDWVQNNIAAFGGDPNSVTIFGESAGSVSVSLHLLSPLSRSKFHRAILQSGTAIMPWAVVPSQEALSRSVEVADSVGCKRDKTEDRVNCMLAVDMKTLIDNQWMTRGILQFPFVPTIDGTFLPAHPDQMVAKGDFKRCPILAGSNMNEASFFLIYEFANLVDRTNKHMDRTEFLQSINQAFFHYPHFPLKLAPNAKQAIRYRYSPPRVSQEDTLKNLHALDMAVSDAQFLCPMNEFIDAYARTGQDVYSYYFTHRIEKHLWPEWMGVVHADEIFFALGHVIEWGTQNYTNIEIDFSQQIIKFWSNFAKTGNPNGDGGQNSVYPTWNKYTTDNMEYLDLNAKYINAVNVLPAQGKALRVDECEFWTGYMPELLKHESSATCDDLTEDKLKESCKKYETSVIKK